MKNIPKRIFIQIGDDASEIAGEFDFEKLVGVTWSTERKHSTDIEYVLKKTKCKESKEYGRKRNPDRI